MQTLLVKSCVREPGKQKASWNWTSSKGTCNPIIDPENIGQECRKNGPSKCMSKHYVCWELSEPRV